ncbi:UNVERIFIED_CONTAM: 1-aminocyclopropane-1-carboxylate oxidase [Sesamum angustifolium]|uniref:1-aminocyclopropane-1-carboxylate oxidase n=1 Tax=Sesamum angustifolium TaxID=2727405 RepID=A0AAW2MVL9_9LAMI
MHRLKFFRLILNGIPVVDFSKVDGKERANTLALIDRYCQEWGFFQLINHGISEELLDRVKKVATECYKLERRQVSRIQNQSSC